MIRFVHKSLTKVSKIILVVAVFFVIINVFMTAVSRDKSALTPSGSNHSAYTSRAYTTLFDPTYQKKPQTKIAVGMFTTVMCSLNGYACSSDPKDFVRDHDKSLIGSLTNAGINAISVPPASGVLWAYNGLQGAGLVPQTYAATGVGFAAITPFQPIWKVFRDLSYMVIVLVMVVIGFMIMFRANMSAQTAISIESALPRIVLALLLITFSYAIAGFMIDLMYVLSAVIVSLLSNGGKFYDPTQKMSEYLTGGISTIGSSIIPQSAAPSFFTTLFAPIFGSNGAGDAGGSSGFGTILYLASSLENLLPGFLKGLLTLIGWIGSEYIAVSLANKLQVAINGLNNIGGFTFDIGNVPGAAVWTVMTVLIGPIVGMILIPFALGIVILFTAAYVTFRILFMLLMAYVKLLLLIIMAPLYMLLVAIPGQKVLSYWFKSMLAEVLTFPMTIGMFLFGYVIINNFKDPTTNAVLWAPPFLYNVDQYAYVFIVGMAVLFMTPDLVKQFKDMMGLKSSSMGSFTPGTFLAGGALAMGAFTGGVGGLKSLVNMMPSGVQNRLLSGSVGNFLGDQFGIKARKTVQEESIKAISDQIKGVSPQTTGNP